MLFTFFSIANKTIEICTNDGGILSSNFVKNNHDFYKMLGRYNTPLLPGSG